MVDPYLGQINAYGFNFAPRSWAMCDGQILPINQYQSLYSLLGTMYGGDGRTSFALPDLRGRASLHFETSQQVGQKGGEEAHTLNINELASHNHLAAGTNATATETSAKSAVLAKGINNLFNSTPNAAELMNNAMIGQTGGGQSHDNMQPYLTLTWCICTQGLFPPRN